MAERPVPRGWTENHWHKSYNAAHSRFYQPLRSEPKSVREGALRAARNSGQIRALALTIRPPAQPAPPQAQSAAQPTSSQANTPSLQHLSQLAQAALTQFAQQQDPATADQAIEDPDLDPHSPAPSSPLSSLPETPRSLSPAHSESLIMATSATAGAPQGAVPSPSGSVFKMGHYPLSSEQDELAYDLHLEDMNQYANGKQAVHEKCQEIHNLEADKCVEHSVQIQNVLRACLTSNKQGSWMSYRPETYLQELTALFESKSTYEVILARCNSEVRAHTKDQLCTKYYVEDPKIEALKDQTAMMFDEGVPTAEAREFFCTEYEKFIDNISAENKEYIERLYDTKDEAEQVAVYREYSTKPRPGDSETMTRLRAKWTGLFDQDLPFKTIAEQITKDETEAIEIEQKLKDELKELKVLSAAKKKKDQKKKQKRQAKEDTVLAEYAKKCARSTCMNTAQPESFYKSAWMCKICYERIKDTAEDTTFEYYCSYECVKAHVKDYHTNKAELIRHYDGHFQKLMELEGEELYAALEDLGISRERYDARVHGTS